MKILWNLLCQLNNIYEKKYKQKTKKTATTIATVPPDTVAIIRNLRKKAKCLTKFSRQINSKNKLTLHSRFLYIRQFVESMFYYYYISKSNKSKQYGENWNNQSTREQVPLKKKIFKRKYCCIAHHNHMHYNNNSLDFTLIFGRLGLMEYICMWIFEVYKFEKIYIWHVLSQKKKKKWQVVWNNCWIWKNKRLLERNDKGQEKTAGIKITVG